VLKKGNPPRKDGAAGRRSAAKGGPRAKPERVLYQDPPPRQRQSKVHHLPDQRRSAPRAELLRGSDGTGSGKASESRPTADTPRSLERIVADKGYSSKDNRSYLRGRGIGVVIAPKDNEHRGGRLDKEAYRQRNLVERLINRLKQFRRVATRYEKRAVNYRAMLTIAAIVLWT
jgi:transposase